MSRINEALKQLQAELEADRKAKADRLAALTDGLDDQPAQPPALQAVRSINTLRDVSAENLPRPRKFRAEEPSPQESGHAPSPAQKPPPLEPDINQAHAHERPPDPPAPPPPPSSPPTDEAVPDEPKKSNSTLGYLLGALLLIGLLATAGVIGTRIIQTETAPPPTNDLVIQGISLMKEKNVVLINGELYEVGDMINGMRIVDITADEIKVLHRGETVSLRPPL